MGIPTPSVRHGFLVRFVVILVALALLTISLSVVVDGEKWTVRNYATSPVVDASPSIAVDADGRVHIAYCALSDGSLRYVSMERGRWTTTVVDSGVVRSPSLALDSNNRAHLFYTLGRDPDCVMKYATTTNEGGDWANLTIDGNLSYYDPHGSIAVDSSNRIHVSYLANKSVVYATNSDGSWHATPALELPWWRTEYGPIHCKIALDSRDLPHITYLYSRGHVGYLSRAGNGTWVDSTLFNWDLSGYDAPIAIDSRDRVHVCYFGSYVPGPSEWGLVYATKNLSDSSGNWSFSLVAVEGGPGYQFWANLLSVDAADNVNIVYGRGGSLVHALLTSSGWRNITSLSVEERTASSMAVNLEGHAQVCLGGPAPEFASESLAFSDGFDEASPASILIAVGLVVMMALLILEIAKWLRGKKNLDPQ